VKKKTDEEKTIARKWPQAKSLENGVKYVVVREGSGEIPASGMRMKVAYSGKSLYDLRFVSTAEGGRPAFGKNPAPFEFEAGKGLVNRGFDSAVAQMRKGEKRILIVPANQAYGTGGFYDKEKPGQKRFHISPNTLLVYEVDVLGIVAR
jgi:FKBP-type peptidyl-prolyl cis-trans isomerase